MKVLEISGLTTEFKTRQGTVKAVNNVSFGVEKGEILGIVGESGSGKSVGMLSMMGLLADNGRVSSGKIIFNGIDISWPANPTKSRLRQYQKKMHSFRGNKMAMIFQDPMTALNPVLKVGIQITEAIQAHIIMSNRDAKKRAVELMELVGIPNPQKRMEQYPFEFSGGMRQRIIIAIALACDPDLLIADEPTTALDVTIQAQILELLQEICRAKNMAVIMITHDLGVVASLCNRVIIMYGGAVAEEGLTDEIYYSPRHPYTVGLLTSVSSGESGEALIPIAGTPPDLLRLPKGCAFMSRCPNAMRICKEFRPPRSEFSETHQCRCWLHSRTLALPIIEGGV
ncbi:ABC transporter ATP-binding protein [Spirochaetia bacterium]|nr:ABC transporter ATP-binding protein [Spirochaetia bacterium]